MTIVSYPQGYSLRYIRDEYILGGMNKPKYIKRLYRITPAQDKLVKKNKKKFGGESEYIRQLIERGMKV